METNGTVSIIIPVHNNEKYVEKCIESVCSQSYQNLEIILVDDGSTDSSAQICDDFARKDTRIVVVHQENGGVSKARNVGIEKATGQYLTFIDGDDHIGSDYILEFVKCMQETGAQMVICGMKKITVGGSIVEEIVPGKYIRYEHEEWCYRICTVACHFYQKHLWDQYEVRFQEGERGEDIPIALFFAAVCEKIVTIQQAEYYYVQHETSATHNYVGLKSITLPYQALEYTIQKISEVGLKNDSEFHELFVLRILTTFIQLAKGAEKSELKRLESYINRILDDYYPYYYKNKRNRIFSDLDITMFQKIAVRVLVWMKRWGMTRLLLRIMCG